MLDGADSQDPGMQLGPPPEEEEEEEVEEEEPAGLPEDAVAFAAASAGMWAPACAGAAPPPSFVFVPRKKSRGVCFLGCG